MNSAEKFALLSAGLFLLFGMITGVWKYAKIMSSAEHKAPVYVDLAHRASLLYSFACLVIAKLIEFSPFGLATQMAIVAIPILYFALAVAGYVREGFLNRTDNMLTERNFFTTWFVYSLIAGEIGGMLMIVGGFVYTQFL